MSALIYNTVVPGSNSVGTGEIIDNSILAVDIDSGAALNGYVLTANGSGGASWVAGGGGGTPAGANTQVQFNNAGAFGASASFTWNGTTLAATNFSGNGSALTSLDGSAIASGTIADARLSANVTVQGNSFNGASELVQLDGMGKLPAIDGSQLTNITGGTPAGADTNVQYNNSGAFGGSGTFTFDGSVVAGPALEAGGSGAYVQISGNVGVAVGPASTARLVYDSGTAKLRVSLNAAAYVDVIAGTVAVADGGTGRTSHTAYAVLCGGTGATTAQQSVVSVGTVGQVLTSNGAGALPTFQTPAGGGVTGSGTTNKIAKWSSSSVLSDSVLSENATQLISSVRVYSVDGTTTNPSYSFTSDPNTGISLDTTGVLGLICAGSLKVRVKAAGFEMAAPIIVTINNTHDIGTSVTRFRDGYFGRDVAVGSTVEFTQIATPSNPAATKNRLYFKSDDNLYMLNSAGTETQVNGGGGITGSGTANYLTYWTGASTVSANVAFQIDATNSRMGIGTSPTHALDIAANTAGTGTIGLALTTTHNSAQTLGAILTGIDANLIVTSGADLVNTVRGLASYVSVDGSLTYPNGICAFSGFVDTSGSLSVASLDGMGVGCDFNSSGTCTNMHGIRVTASTSAGTVTSSYGIEILVSNSSTTTTMYGLKIADVSGATTNYAIHTGLGTVRLGDSIQCSGGIALNIVSKVFGDSPYTALATDYTILVNATGGAVTVTIPNATSFATGKIFVIKKTDASANNVTISIATGTVDGVASISFNTQYQSYTIQSDGTNWHVI